MLNDLINLFISFAKIGFSSFGGLSMLSVINEEMQVHGWLSAQEVLDVVAIAEMTPGSLGMNSATFTGMKVAGVIGAMIGSLGVLVPSLTTGMAAAIFLTAFKENKYLKNALYGIRPTCIGMIVSTGLVLGSETFISNGLISFPSIIIAIIILILFLKTKITIPIAIMLAAALGLLIA